jgi:hypothetical protein
MTTKEDDSRKLRMLLAIVPIAMPDYCDDLKTQRRVGKTISAAKLPPNFEVRTIWL